MNERFDTYFKSADALFFEEIIAEAKDDDEVVQPAKANALDNFALSMKGKLDDTMIDRIDRDQQIASRYLNEREFRDVLFPWLVKRIYEEIRGAEMDTAG